VGGEEALHRPSDEDHRLVVQQPLREDRREPGRHEHHDLVRFAWELEAPDGTVAVAGVDVGELAPDGRLRRIAGFFEEAAA
jgi:hypothetical protein